MRELLSYAAQRGISVHVAHLPHPYRGFFDAVGQRIVYDFDLTPIERRVVLAHELGHAHYGHDCEDDDLSEQQADVFAAHMLINPRDYQKAERLTQDTDYIAEELEVTPDLVDVYQKHCLVRMRGVTYLRPRMGSGQWAGRVVHA